MAGAADKKQAQRNAETLSSVHKLSLIINLISIICVYIIQRPKNGKFYYLLYSLPLFFCEYTVEKIGRPTYTFNADGYKVLVKSGEDLQQSGLTEYMFDIVYLTLFIDILMCLFGTVKVWWTLIVIPIFAGWKLKGIISSVMKMFLPNLRSPNNANKETAETENSGKSKRQLKMEKRGNKQKVRYR